MSFARQCSPIKIATALMVCHIFHMDRPIAPLVDLLDLMSHRADLDGNNSVPGNWHLFLACTFLEYECPLYAIFPTYPAAHIYQMAHIYDSGILASSHGFLFSIQTFLCD